MGMSKKRMYLATSCLAGALVFGTLAYAHGPGQGDPNGNLEPLTAEIEQGEFGVVLEPVADGLIAPNWGVTPPGLTGRLFVTDQDGILWNVELATGDKSVFLDVKDLIVTVGAFGPGSFDERGLLGLAFHPDYATNGLFYTYTSEPYAETADFSTVPDGTADHQSVVAEWQVADPGAEEPSVLMNSRRVVLRVDQPQFNHDGGAIDFGPDGMLYIAFGDGGAADDDAPGHGIDGNGQDASNPLGSILRIDPLGSNSVNGQYGVPDDNPFVATAGFLPETFAYGFRNPYRMSFDQAGNGDLYTGDVGQNDIEEVDLVVAGGNYGWRLKEGSFYFDKDGDRNGNGFASKKRPRGLPKDLIDPVAEYDTHIDGHSVIGGFVYRGSQFPELQGRYIFGEFAKTILFGQGVFTWARIFYLDDKAPNGVTEFHYAGGVNRLPWALLGFGQDSEGEIYFLANTTGVPFGAGENLDEPTGAILRIVSVDE